MSELRRIAACARGWMPVLSMAGIGLSAQAADCGPARGADGQRAVPFVWTESTSYQRKPDFSAVGVRTIPTLANTFWEGNQRSTVWRGDGSDGTVDKTVVDRQVAARLRDESLAVLDFEMFPMAGVDADRSVRHMQGILGVYRQGAPKTRLGFYGTPPIWNYRGSVQGPASADYRDWQARNDRLRPLAQAVDVLFPSLYTMYADVDGWSRFAEAQICEARRLAPGKPVIAFIWPQFHENNKDLHNAFMPVDFWRRQLEVVYRLADGVVIWGGWDGANNRPAVWDEQAPWWKETLAFMRSVEATPAKRP